MKSSSDLARRFLGAASPEGPSSRRHLQQLPLPVTVRGRGAPDGVPLEEILAAAKAAASTVEGLVVRDGELTVVHSAEPDAGQRERLDRLFADRGGLLALGRAVRRTSLTVLLDEATPDALWLKAFRQWAVSELLARDGAS